MESRQNRSAAARGYQDIGDYALLGDCRTAALLAPDGSIDWLCWPRFDSAALFARLLDAAHGGFWRVGPADATGGMMRYRPETAIVDTDYDVPGARVRLTDAMLLPFVDGTDGSALLRIARVEAGTATIESLLDARPEYGRLRAQVEANDDGASFAAGQLSARLRIIGAAPQLCGEDAAGMRHRVQLQAGEQAAFLLELGGVRIDDPLAALEACEQRWQQYCRRCMYEGAHADQVKRSSVTLKLLTYARTGAIVAAPTTSLPERVGGVRNWDYRYTWLRDASMTAYALLALEQHHEADAFVEWLCARVAKLERIEDLHIVYDVDGSADLPERELTHLDGYRGSRPVRVGNGAVQQLQLDVFGQVLDALLQLVGHDTHADIVAQRLLEHAWPQFRRVAEFVADNWQQPDSGIWEVRSAPRHFTHSRVMCWVALDRAITLARHYELDGDIERWQQTAEQIHDDVLSHGFSTKLGAFRQSYDSELLDAANLRIGLLKFLPASDPRVQGTIDATIEHLTRDGLVYRYLGTGDGVAGSESTFALCTFWLVSALAQSGRLEEARELFEQMVARTGPLGLYGEQIDPTTGAMLGNYPQAFTHLGLITAAVQLAQAGALDAVAAAAAGGEPSSGYRFDR